MGLERIEHWSLTMSAFFVKKQKIEKVEPVDSSEDARDIRRRISGRGGRQSTLLSDGAGLTTQASIFKSNLAGTQS